MRSRLERMFVVGIAAVASVAVLARNTPIGPLLRNGTDRAARWIRYEQGRLQGLQYRLSARRPDPGVDDETLAERVRSTLGPVAKRLDIPRVGVAVDDHIVVLQGSVASEADARAIEREVEEIPGVRGVESYLHVGFAAGDTRPSEGRARAAREPSPALRRLLDAATRSGASEDRSAVRAVLATFAERVPAGERAQLLAHLPADVRELASTPRRSGARVARFRTVSELVGTIAERDADDAVHAEAITESVLGHLRQLVPEEVDDIAATLPDDLRALWKAAVPG